jgi:D-sedoheptulose 7-phosphate isomerase
MEDHIAGYLSQLQSVLTNIVPGEINAIVQVLHRARLEGRSIFLLANGGSSATASHWANDLCKCATRAGVPNLRVIALTDNVPLITACGKRYSL